MCERDRCTAQLWVAVCARADVSAPRLVAPLYRRGPLSERPGSAPGSRSPQAALGNREWEAALLVIISFTNQCLVLSNSVVILNTDKKMIFMNKFKKRDCQTSFFF